MATEGLERLHQDLARRLSKARVRFALRRRQQDSEFERVARDRHQAYAGAVASGAACASGENRSSRRELTTRLAYALRPASSQ